MKIPVFHVLRWNFKIYPFLNQKKPTFPSSSAIYHLIVVRFLWGVPAAKRRLCWFCGDFADHLSSDVSGLGRASGRLFENEIARVNERYTEIMRVGWNKEK